MKKVGILGGGQLGAMIAESVLKLGATPVVYDPDPAAPAARVASSVHARWDDVARLQAFFNEVDAATYEFEHVPTAPLEALEGLGKLQPSLEVLRVCQHRVREKLFLREHSFPHVEFLDVEDIAASRADIEAFGFPCIVKSAVGGYDGHHQYRFDSARELDRALPTLVAQGLALGGWVVERVASIAMELSCIVAADGDRHVSFPAFENEHRDHILDKTWLPARVSGETSRAISEVATRVARSLQVHGLLTVEFFLSRDEAGPAHVKTGDGYLYVNELAPRPHNSGHVTRNACTMSQFDALARILLRAPLTPPAMTSVAEGKVWCMGNLLGDVWLAQHNERADELRLDPWARHPEVIDVVLYGKLEPRTRRKMGHVVAVGTDGVQAAAHVDAFRDALRLRSRA